MILEITNTDNEAFTDQGEESESAKATEIARILRSVASRIERGWESGHCIDDNGNKVGTWTL